MKPVATLSTTPSTRPPNSAPDVADPADHGGRERLDADEKAEREVDLGEEERDEDAADRRQRGAEPVHQQHHAVHVDSHERSGLEVLGCRARRLRPAGPMHELLERHHQAQRNHHDEHPSNGMVREPMDTAHALGITRPVSTSLNRAPNTDGRGLKEERDPESADDDAHAPRVSQRSVGEPLDPAAKPAAYDHCEVEGGA
jgi:hypothetical protein